MIEINYTPATIHPRDKDYYIDWYVIADGKKHRKKVRLNNIEPKRRPAYAQMLCDQINSYLERNLDPFQHIPFLQGRIKKFGNDAAFLQDVTFNDGYQKYLQLICKKGRREETTSISYKYIYKQFDEFMLNTFPQIKFVHQIKENHIITYFDYLLSRPVSGTTHDNHLYNLRSIWNKYFIKRNAAVKNPFMAVDAIKPSKKKRKPKYNSLQLNLIRDKIIEDNPYIWSICGLVFYCFMRPIEITRLYISNFNFETGFIHLESDQVKDDEERLIKIPDEFISHLIAFGYDKLPGNYFFTGSDNFAPGLIKLKRKKITDRTTRMLKNIGISNPELRLYRLKHTGISKFRAEGGDKEVTMFQAGHNNDEEHYTYYDEYPIEKYKQFNKFSINPSNQHQSTSDQSENKEPTDG